MACATSPPAPEVRGFRRAVRRTPVGAAARGRPADGSEKSDSPWWDVKGVAAENEELVEPVAVAEALPVVTQPLDESE